MTFNPCSANILSLCPLNASVPINTFVMIPVDDADVAGIPNIALSIPDFEGSAILRLFSNTTQTEVACFQAVMTNGATFSHPAAISSILGILTIVAMFASFATGVYGINIAAMRTHYAHSLPVLVVFEVFQSIFFTGALNVEWPSVLPAFWSNFAWSAGLIHTKHMTNSINKFIGKNGGNISEVGSAGSTILNNNGGLQKRIYDVGRDVDKYWKLSQKSIDTGRDLIGRLPRLDKRDFSTPTANNASLGIGYSWSGGVVNPGLPLPGTWSGFSGTLSDIQIPASDAFLIGLVWFIIIFVILIAATIMFKWAVEGMVRMKWLREDRLEIFRSSWIGFLGVIALRITLIAFSSMMILTLYQFSMAGNSGTIALAAIFFLIFFTGGLAITGYACYYRLRYGSFSSSPDRLLLEHKKFMGFLPWISVVRQTELEEKDTDKKYVGSIPFFKIQYTEKNEERLGVHEDTTYIKRFGWLSARYRRTRWWFFSYWVAYQFIRACFIGGAQNNPHAQVYGLLVIEIIAFIAIAWMSPFESRRNTALAVYMLSISKILSTALSIAFFPELKLNRIIATVLGVVIIVIQGLLVIGTIILIVLGAISSYFSIMRNREEFTPKSWDGIRIKYYAHLEQKATDLPPVPVLEPQPQEPIEPYFSVKSVLRVPKVEDEGQLNEEDDSVSKMGLDGKASTINSNGSIRGPLPSGRNRSHSVLSNMSYGQLPYGARVHRASWSSRDFNNVQIQDINRSDSPFGTPSKAVRGTSSGTHTANSSIDNGIPPLPKPAMRSVTGHSRPTTPTKETLAMHANERFASAKF